MVTAAALEHVSYELLNQEEVPPASSVPRRTAPRAVSVVSPSLGGFSRAQGDINVRYQVRMY